MSAKLSHALWSASLSLAAVVIYLLYITLWIPPAAEANTEGNIILASVVNVVNHRPAGSIAWSPARPGYRLQENDAIRAGAASVAEIIFDNNTRLILQENSMIIIKSLGTSQDGSLVGANLVLDEGQVNFVAPKKKTRDTLAFLKSDEPQKKPESAITKAASKTEAHLATTAPPAALGKPFEPATSAVALAALPKSQTRATQLAKEGKLKPVELIDAKFDGNDLVLEAAESEMSNAENLALADAKPVPQEAPAEAAPRPILKIEAKGTQLDVSNSEGAIKAGKDTAELQINAGTAKIQTEQGVIAVNNVGKTTTKLQLTQSADSGKGIQVASLSGKAQLELGDTVVDVVKDSGLLLSKEGPIKKITIPEAPQLQSDDIRVSLGNFLLGQAQLSWKPTVTTATNPEQIKYKVNFYKKSDLATPITTVEVKSTNYVVRNLKPGEYLYSVASIVDNIVGKESNPKSLRITLPPPPVLTHTLDEFSETDVANNAILGTWPAIEEGVDTKYRVRIYKASDLKQPVLQQDQTETKLQLTNLQPGEYVFQVSTLMLGYEGRPSKPEKFTIFDSQSLAPPQLNIRAESQKVEYTDKPKPLNLSWIGNSKRYRVQIAKNKSFTPGQIVFDDIRDQPNVQVTLKSGEYYWRVASLVGEKTLGDFSPIETIHVSKILPPSVFVSSPMRYDVVYSDEIPLVGKTEPGNTVELRMVWAGNQQLHVNADGTFNQQVKLRRGRNKFTVTIKNSKGQVAERVHEIILLPPQLAKSSTVAKVKQQIDQINAKLVGAYQELEVLRREALSDADDIQVNQNNIKKIEDNQVKLEFQVKTLLGEIEPFIP